MSSLSRAALSYCSASEASFISAVSFLMNRAVCPDMKSQKSSASSRCSSSVIRLTQGAEHFPMYPSRQGRPIWPARLNTPVEQVHREDAQQRVDRVADRPGVRVRPEIPGALPLGAAHHHDPGVLLVHRHREVGVALVVAVLDVEPGVELLDPGVLQLEGLDLG